MRTVDLKTLMDWNPCQDFPRERIEVLFAGREKVTAADVFHVELLRQDEQLWVVLREAFFNRHELEHMAAQFALHVWDLANNRDPSIANAFLHAVSASAGNFDLLPEDERQDRWKKGATDSEKCASLSALWAATARANTETDKKKRLKKWDKERDWQIKHVKERAGL